MAITLSADQFKQKYGQDGIDKFQGATPVAPQPAQPKQGFLDQIGSSLMKRGQDIVNTFKDTAQGKINPLETGIQTVGAVAGGVGDAIGAGVGAVAKAVVPEAAKQAGLYLLQTKTGKDAISALGKGMDHYKQWAAENPRASKDLESVLNIAAFVPAYKGAEVAGSAAMDAAKGVAETAATGVKDVASLVAEKIPQYSEKASQMLASEPSTQVKTILQETPTEKFDQYVKMADAASKDPRAKTGFEHVGELMSDATKQLKGQMTSIAEQKSTIMAKAKNGLQPFTEAPRKAILDLMKLDSHPVVDEAITKLKAVKTKAQADKAIDDIQQILYTAKDNKTIAGGSSLEKQVKGIVGKMNGALKADMPPAYQTLNLKYANRAKVVDVLNRSLGEVVDGVPTRGASLIKQFFSPSGSKTKELFDFIKQNTGVDLAQDTSLAKFTGELFGDPKVKSLLEGKIPTSKGGLVNGIMDTAIEKTGVGKLYRDTARNVNIKNARKLTK